MQRYKTFGNRQVPRAHFITLELISQIKKLVPANMTAKMQVNRPAVPWSDFGESLILTVFFKAAAQIFPALTLVRSWPSWNLEYQGFIILIMKN